MRHIKRAALAAAFSAALMPAWADGNSMRDIMGLKAVGGGPGVFGVMPGKSMVSLYGSVDVGLGYIKSNGKSLLRVENGNVFASKWGIYGQEDLGGQLTAYFRLESAFDADSGKPQSQTSFFNRGSYVGLASPRWGNLSLGRQLSGEGAMAIGSDVFLASARHSIFSYLAGYADLGYGSYVDLARVNNSISYTTPQFGPFSANAFYAFKSNRTVGPKTKNASLTVSYRDSMNIATASYSQTYCEASASSSTPCMRDATQEPTVRTDNALLTYLHDFGGFTGAAAYLWNRPRFPGNYSSQMLTLGAEKRIDRHLLRASIGFRDTSQPGNHAWGMTLGEDYYLSKRTSLYARVGFLKNGSKSAQTYNFDAANAFPMPAVNKSVVSTSIGITHHF